LIEKKEGLGYLLLMGKKKWLKTAGVLIVIILTVIWMGSKPSKGKIILNKTEEKIEKKTTEQQQYSGKFFDFWYDNKYSVRAEENREKVELLGGKGDSSHWVIVAQETGIRDLTEVSGVQFRRLNRSDYQEKEVEIDGATGLFFKKMDKSEFLALTIKDGKLITVALTINSNDETAEQKFIDFVNRIEIK